MKKSILLIFVLFVYSSCSDSVSTDTRKYTIQGVVQYEVDMSALSNITVVLIGSGLHKEYITDSNGEFIFDNLPTGDYTIIINESLYKPVELNIFVPHSDLTIILESQLYNYFPINLNDVIKFKYTKSDVTPDYENQEVCDMIWTVSGVDSTAEYKDYTVQEKLIGQKLFIRPSYDDNGNFFWDTTITGTVDREFEFHIIEDSQNIQLVRSIPYGSSNYFCVTNFQTKYSEYQGDTVEFGFDPNYSNLFLKLNAGIDYYNYHTVGGNSFTKYILEREY